MNGCRGGGGGCDDGDNNDDDMMIEPWVLKVHVILVNMKNLKTLYSSRCDITPCAYNVHGS